MSCPQCGASKGREIAPGFFECLGTRTVTDTQMVPDIGNPGWSRPMETSRSVVCGFRYQEAAPASTSSPPCFCGMFSVALCCDCDTPVCGDHSGLVDDRRVCARCLPAARQARQERRAAERARQSAEAGHRAERALYRFLAVAEARGWPGVIELHSFRRLDPVWEQQFMEESEQLRKAWESGPAIAQWYHFEHKRKMRRYKQLTQEWRDRLGQPTPVVARGWQLPQGAPTGTRPVSHHGGIVRDETVYQDMALLTDGRLAHISRQIGRDAWWLVRSYDEEQPPFTPLEVLYEVRRVADRVGIGSAWLGDLALDAELAAEPQRKRED